MKGYFRKTIAAASALVICACSGAVNVSAEVTPNPVISRGVPAYSEANPATATAANDEHYFSFWFGTAPDYIAYDLSEVPKEQKKSVIAVWYNTSSYDSIGMYVNSNMVPSDYTIEVNSAEGGTFPKDGWKVVAEVKDNTLGSRQHLVDMEDYNWIRMNISKADGAAGKQASVNFDIHNVSEGVADSWLFLGDSITAGGMNNCYGTGFATHVNKLDSRYFPVQENGGIGGITSTDGRDNIDRWLEGSPVRYVSIAYGTNDAWGNPNNVDKFYNNTKYMIDAVLALGKIPVLPKIPGSTNSDVAPNVPLYNAKVEQLYEEYGDKLIQGPDFEKFFTENPDLLSQDGVHPSSEGYEAMRKEWAETMYRNVYQAESSQPEPTAPVTTVEATTVPTTSVPAETTTVGAAPEIVYGDVTLNGEVGLSDALAILQYVANAAKYPLTDEALDAADVYDRGDGITAMDALSIQKYDAKLISELPESYLK